MLNVKLTLFWLLAFLSVPLAAQDEEVATEEAILGDTSVGAAVESVGEPETAVEAEPVVDETEVVGEEPAVEEVQAEAAETAEAAPVKFAQTTQLSQTTGSAPVPLPEPGKDSKTGKPDFLSDGTRVTVRDGDFSIVPPLGWEVFTNLESLTLLMQVPHQPGMRYQRTIQVASFSEPRFIDEITAKEYEKVIVGKFSSISSAIEEYRIRNHMTVDLADGRQGILFYTEFKLEGVDLMQAHILVSSATRHYLMTFTDVAEHFESDAASQFLTEAWDSLISVEMSTRTPKRFETFAAIGVGVVVLVVLGFGLVVFRSWRSGRKYQDYANGRDGDSVSLDPQTLASGDPISNVRSIVKSKSSHAFTKTDTQLDDDDLDVPTTKDDIAI